MSTLIFSEFRIFFQKSLNKLIFWYLSKRRNDSNYQFDQSNSSNFRLRVSPTFRKLFQISRDVQYKEISKELNSFCWPTTLKIWKKTFLKSKIKLQASPYTGHKSSRSIETIHMNEIRSESYDSWISHAWWVTDS